MFGDQAGFGRISEPANCWAPPKERPSVPCQRIRQYKTVYGAVCPETGESFYHVMDGSNKENMTFFLKKLSEKYPDHIILLVLDNASWHMTQQENSKRRSKNKTAKSVFKTQEKLIVPSNIYRRVCRGQLFRGKYFQADRRTGRISEAVRGKSEPIFRRRI